MNVKALDVNVVVHYRADINLASARAVANVSVGIRTDVGITAVGIRGLGEHQLRSIDHTKVQPACTSVGHSGQMRKRDQQKTKPGGTPIKNQSVKFNGPLIKENLLEPTALYIIH